MKAEAAAAAFDLGAAVDAIEPHPSGHINDAFLVTAGGRRFLLQRLNPYVFPDPDALMANVVTITEHLRAKGEPTLTLVSARDGTRSWRDDTTAVWRMYVYVDGMRTAEVRSPVDASVVGRAFGRFHRLTADLDSARLQISLPGFHDAERRLAVLEKTVADDPHGHALDVNDEVEALVGLRNLAETGAALATLPRRAVHNDAKAANLLVDDSGERLPVVVDLDTVMPGTILWDVGDMVRSSTGTPDEATAVVRFDRERYDALVDAWHGEVAELITPEEEDAVGDAGPVLVYEQAVRFLTDHLQGDVYFRITRPGQNLDRARNQLALLQSMLQALAA